MIQKPKGTYDVFSDKADQIQYLEKLFQGIMKNYHYQFIRTPLFEASELFHRSVGQDSDIIRKETYDFSDRSNRQLTLRPEGTAGVVRSFIENKRYAEAIQPIKVWYYGSMYRYERPQAGRYREFYQFGVEVFGTSNPIMDAEVISIPVTLYQMLGLKDIKVKINTLGDQESRENYRKALLEYFKPYLQDLCEDCQARYQNNPLRILDCKIDADSDILKNAPKITDYLNEESKIHFEKVKEALESLEIPYEIGPNLVRGLDYYTHTVFEVQVKLRDKTDVALCGGGRYDHLVETLQGPETKAVGFALGLERLLAVLDQEKIELPKEKLDIYVIPLEESVSLFSFNFVQSLRLNGFSTDMDYLNRSLKANFKQVDRIKPSYLIMIGETEIENQYFTVKNNNTKEETKVPWNQIITYLDEHLKEENDEDIH